MVLELQFRNWFRLANLIFFASICGVSAYAGESGDSLLRDAQALYQTKQYFSAARYAFQAKEVDPALSAESDSWITLSLVRAELYQSASYFFIRTLQSGNSTSIRRVLSEAETLLLKVEWDLLKKYLIRHTQYSDYNSVNRSAYLYALGRTAFLSGEVEKSLGYLAAIDQKSKIYPFALQLRGSVYALMGKNEAALQDFKECADSSSGGFFSGRVLDADIKDLNARCLAGQARTLYQMNRFEDADLTYDQISKDSRVWPEILFEQAWNSYAREEYNRTLGKLVSYKSPALSFIFNPEVEVLQAQTYLALCLYKDTQRTIEDFNSKYGKIGEQIKSFVEGHSGNLDSFYALGEQALNASKDVGMTWVIHSFVRAPYFKGLTDAQKAVAKEIREIQELDASELKVTRGSGQGFAGFLRQVLKWRSQSIRTLGGAFIKNGLMDQYSDLISQLDKMSFIRLDLLKRAKDRLILKSTTAEVSTDRNRGNVRPERRDYQYYWSFNGEFWNDELGDYVFGLESECKGDEGV